MAGLNDTQRRKALSLIAPRKLGTNRWSNNNPAYEKISEIANFDWGRGLLNSERYCFTETIPLFDELDFLKNESAKVKISTIDSIITAISLKAFSKSFNIAHEGDLAILVPPMSYGYPLLIAYHLILQHLAISLGAETSYETKFHNNSGIMIITDNFELLSRVWRTSISNVYLRKFINTFTLKAGKFKKFEPGENKSGIGHEDDGTLPWLCLYRAVRHLLPEQLEKRTQVIILDLLPYRHRKRTEELVTWAKENSDHVIVTAPLYDDCTYSSLRGCLRNILAFDRFAVGDMLKHFDSDDFSMKSNKITNAWSLNASIPYLTFSLPSFTLLKVTGLDRLEECITEAYKILSRSYNKDGTQSKAFRRLTSMFFDIISLPIDVSWYERVRLNYNKARVNELIDSCSKIPGSSFEEDQIQKDLLSHAVESIRKIYDLLSCEQRSPRGEALCEIIRKNVEKRILVIVANKVVVPEVKVWIRSMIGVSAKSLVNITVISQEEWAKRQLNNLYDDQSNYPEMLVLTNLWSERYLSSFYIHPETQVFYTCLNYEIRLVKNQLMKVYLSNENYKTDFETSLQNILEIEYKSDVEVRKGVLDSIKVEEFRLKALENTSERSSNLKNQNLDELFSSDILMSMLNNEQIDETEGVFEDLSIVKINKDLDVTDEKVSCMKIKGFNRTRGVQLNFLFSQYNTIQVVRLGVDEVVNLKPIDLQPGDYWIRLRQNEKRQLFDSILEMSSNTMTMQWINMNVQEWKEMTKILWETYYDGTMPKKYAYKKIWEDLIENDGNIETTYSIKNWILGDVSSVKNEKNVLAVAKIIGDSYYLDRVKIIHKAMNQLGIIHRNLGRKLASIISKYAIMKQVDHSLLPEWVEIGNDIRIPVLDILNAIELVQIDDIDKETDYFTYTRLIEHPIADDVFKHLIERDLIMYEE